MGGLGSRRQCPTTGAFGGSVECRMIAAWSERLFWRQPDPSTSRFGCGRDGGYPVERDNRWNPAWSILPGHRSSQPHEFRVITRGFGSKPAWAQADRMFDADGLSCSLVHPAGGELFSITARIRTERTAGRMGSSGTHVPAERRKDQYKWGIRVARALIVSGPMES